MHRSIVCFALALLACSDPPLIPEEDAGPSLDAGPPDAGADAGPGYAVFFDEGIDPSVAERFANAAASPVAAPEIVYPESGTLVPPNMLGVDVHFRATVVQAFEITFAQSGAPSVVAYVRCAPVGDGCIFQPWREVWRALAERRGAGPYAIRIRGLAGDGVTASSAPVVLELADEEIHGGLYYFAIDEYPPAIRRHELGLARRSAESFLEPDGYSPTYVVSRDGTRIALANRPVLDEPTTSIYDVVTRERIGVIADQNMQPRYGAGHDLLYSFSGTDIGEDRPIRIVSGEDGSVLREWTTLGPAHSADWSPDEKRIVYAETVGLRGIHFEHELHVLERGDDGEWLPPRRLETPGERPTEPSFAPDSDWIAYTALDFTRQDEVGRFWPLLCALRVSDGRLVRLDRAHASPDPADYAEASGVRWNPSPYTHDGRRIYWLTFSSDRPAGLLPRSSYEEYLPGRQIWMAAFEPDSDAEDPSRPAFRVPAQRWGFNNEHAEWALTVRRTPCETDEQCPEGEVCQGGVCYEAPE